MYLCKIWLWIHVYLRVHRQVLACGRHRCTLGDLLCHYIHFIFIFETGSLAEHEPYLFIYSDWAASNQNPPMLPFSTGVTAHFIQLFMWVLYLQRSSVLHDKHFSTEPSSQSSSDFWKYQKISKCFIVFFLYILMTGNIRLRITPPTFIR